MTEVVTAISAYTGATVSKATEPAKPPGDPHELLAKSLVPHFHQIAKQSLRKFALPKAKLAVVMVEIELDDQVPPASSERSCSVPQRPEATYWGTDSGFRQLTYQSLDSNSFGLLEYKPALPASVRPIISSLIRWIELAYKLMACIDNRNNNHS